MLFFRPRNNRHGKVQLLVENDDRGGGDGDSCRSVLLRHGGDLRHDQLGGSDLLLLRGQLLGLAARLQRGWRD